MQLRSVTYGYEFKNGRIIIKESESKIVKKIFKDYLEGNYFQQISNNLHNQNIEYFNGESNWSKRKVARIIENVVYMGNEKYPAIIDEETFKKANVICNSRSTGKLSIPSDIAYLKKNIYCEQCGRLYVRKGDKIRTERWYCPNGCITKQRLKDRDIVNSIKNITFKIKNDMSLLKSAESKIYNQTPEIVRYNNEISNIINCPEPNINLGKSLVLKCLSLRFKQCHEDKGLIYADVVRNTINAIEDQENFCCSDIKGIIKKIYINREGKIKIQFINDLSMIE